MSDSVRPLKDPVILYVDDGGESQNAKSLFENAGVRCVLSDGPVEPLQFKPLAIYLGGTYQGIGEIRGLIDLLMFWSKQSPLIQRDLFQEA